VFTSLIIAALIIAGGITAVGGGLIFAARRRNALPDGGDQKLLGTGANSNLLERGFSDLRVNDIVQYSGQDYLVEGVIRYDEAGHEWSMANIVDGKDQHWLLVGLERSGSASKRLLQSSKEVDLNGYPPELLVIGEHRYEFDKRGTATASLAGDTGTLSGGNSSGGTSAHRCRWWSYRTAGDSTLLVEQWGDDYRVLVGQSVGDTDLEMMPGS
jgi:hypothetical protein